MKKPCNTCIHGRKKKGIKEFSKKVIICLTLAWFLGLALAIAVTIFELATLGTASALSDTLIYIGAPMTGGVLGYLIKSALENREKIKNSDADTADPIDNIYGI